MNWNVIKYKEQEGTFSRIKKFIYKLFGKDINNEYINGYINFASSAYFNLNNYVINNKTYILIGEISIFNMYNNEYIEYKRRNINSFWDLLAKVGSLFMIILSFFKFCFKYYSKNFDNYQIIKNMHFNNIMKIKDIKYESIKLSINDDNDNSSDNNEQYSSLINDNSKEKNCKNDYSLNNNKLSCPLIKDISKEKNNINNIVFNDNEEKINEKKTTTKHHFWDFFLYNLYCNCCIKSNKQKLIQICIDIISKYMSIDSLLCNQLILENLLKDYKWNNPMLNNLETNDFINKYRHLL